MSLANTPISNRLHIGIFGKQNSGKSSLINALTSQEIAIVSDIAGTTTDPVYKTMEINGIGPCVFIDTAGFDDSGVLGEMRVEKTKKAMEKADIALIVLNNDDISIEVEWIKALQKLRTPVVVILNKVDLLENEKEICRLIKQKCGLTPIAVSAKNKSGIDKVRDELIHLLPEDYEIKSIVGQLVKEGDVVLLVMPQDIQAPKGRLILPQVQTIRDLLDKKCMVLSITVDMLDQSLAALSKPPELIITDSQVFKTVYEKKPEESKLTSFSILFAKYKGDINVFVEGANAIERLTENSRVLIAEACTHAPLSEDIGREKIPRMLRKMVGNKITIDIISGSDFPENLTSYDLIIHCGSCMFNRKYVLSRVERALAQEIPITNYGVFIAYISGILNKVVY